MSQISTLVTGAGVTTIIPGQAQCEEYLVIGDVDTANPLQALSVEIDGTPFLVINVAALITAYMKWLMKFSATVVGLMIKVSTGMIKKNTTYRLTNAGATTPGIFAFSDSQNGIPFVVTSVQINPNGYQDFNKFSALFLSAPANIGTLEVTFADGHRTTMTGVEADAYFLLKNDSEANGQLGGVTCIDNTDRAIKSVRVFAVVAALNVLQAKIPQAAYEALKEEAGEE